MSEEKKNRCTLYIAIECDTDDVDNVFEDIKSDTECMDGNAKVTKLKIESIEE